MGVPATAAFHHHGPGPTSALGAFNVTVGLNGSSSPTSSNTTANAQSTTSSSTATAAAPSIALSPQDKQVLLANEKRRRRRESHNAVERRRRDNINEKITELATLIPECMLEGGTVTSTGVPASPTETHFLDGANDPLFPTLSMKREDAVVKEEAEGSVATIAGVGGSADNGVVKANKGMILRKSVEYIR